MIMDREWREALERDGLTPVQVDVPVDDTDGVPCPACGTCAPLVDGACSDCGLFLG